MPIPLIHNKQSIAPLFAGWEQTMIASCLQDCMGAAYAIPASAPVSAQILIGGFGFFAGVPSEPLAQNNPDGSLEILVPQNASWEHAIEAAYPGQLQKRTRYATRKDPGVFSVSHLETMAAALAPPYSLHPIDAALYHQIMESGWAVDLCANFSSSEDFLAHGLGVAVLKNGEIVSGASSYTYYKGGIEIEIDTRRDERRKGLAAACAAQLILICLRNGLYPSWDAHTPGSLALAQKLGYHFDRSYPVYEFSE